ncbi:MAG: hypothetical protein K2K97_07615 [Muribaculaceae bacterium]|nr:hypothetical protein [Muribaculaceae bacterium]
MGAKAEMIQEGKIFSDGLDAVVIRRAGACIIGGRTLDMTGFPDKHVRAGHIIVHETATDTWKPLGVSNGAYSALPEGHTYEGVLRASKPADMALASIMYEGEVNDLASPYPVTDSIKTAMKAALPGLYFKHD